MHNIYINNILYIVNTPTCFDALHHLQGVLSFYYAKVTKIIKFSSYPLEETPTWELYL